MWHDLFNAALGLACLTIGGLTVRFLSTIDALAKTQDSHERDLAQVREQHAKEIRDVRSDVSNIRGHLKLPPFPYQGD